MASLGDLFTDIADAIRTKTGEEGTMKPADFATKIESISVGGGSSELVGYVTFMNGETELYKMPVLIGDDCKDPISHGDISTPTKESTVSTVYSYAGWSAIDGGSVDNTVLNNITEDKTVYAAYEESTRYYTVTFYDEDGTTVLNTMEFGYGQIPSYTPSKSGYTFGEWTTELVPVTGDTSYIASWKAEVYFASSDWAAISAVCEAGEAEQYFSLGDTRTISLTKDDTNYACTLKIVGFNHDDLSDGTGKAGITVAFFCFPRALNAYNLGYMTSDRTYKSSYKNDEYSTYVDSLLDYFPTGLKSVIKTVSKDISLRTSASSFKGSCTLFPMSFTECGYKQLTTYYTRFANSSVSAEYLGRMTGTCYKYFEDSNYYGNRSNTNTCVSQTENPTNYYISPITRDIYYRSIDNKIVYIGFDGSDFFSSSQIGSTNIPALAFCV